MGTQTHFSIKVSVTFVSSSERSQLESLLSSSAGHKLYALFNSRTQKKSERKLGKLTGVFVGTENKPEWKRMEIFSLLIAFSYLLSLLFIFRHASESN